MSSGVVKHHSCQVSIKYQCTDQERPSSASLCQSGHRKKGLKDFDAEYGLTLPIIGRIAARVGRHLMLTAAPIWGPQNRQGSGLCRLSSVVNVVTSPPEVSKYASFQIIMARNGELAT